MSLYLGAQLAALRQAELLDEAANERLVRMAREGHTGSRRGHTTGKVLVVLAFAILTFGMLARPTAAATVVYNLSKGVCDTTTSPPTVYASVPKMYAVDDTSAVDVNYVRYWVRFYDASTGAVLTDWVYGGQATATEATPGAFSTTLMHGAPVGASWRKSTSNPVRAQFSLAWYRPDWTVRVTLSPSLNLYKVWQGSYVYVYGSGLVWQSGYVADQTYC